MQLLDFYYRVLFQSNCISNWKHLTSVFLKNQSVFFVTQVLKDKIQDCRAQNKDLAFQTVSGICTVRSFRGEKDEVKRYSEAVNQMCKVKKQSGIYSAVFCLARRVSWPWCLLCDDTKENMLRFKLIVWSYAWRPISLLMTKEWLKLIMFDR